MRLTSIKLVLSCLLLLLFSACDSSSKKSLDLAIGAQEISQDPCSASFACTAAFDTAESEFKNQPSQSFCTELLARSDGDIAICEVDIRNPKYTRLLSGCQDQIENRLRQISFLRNVGMPNPNAIGEVNLPTQIQLRDTSHGYRAVTGDVKQKQVIFTFDDGPEATNTLSVLRTLAAAKMKAHFFELGERIRANPQITKMIASQGHSLGNHSWNHPNMQKISYAQAASQIKKTHALIFSVLGWADPFFRFPYGNRTTRLGDLLSKNSMAEFYWAVDSNDWRMKNSNGSLHTNLQVINETMSQLNNRGRGIVLLHDIHRRTAELLPELLHRVETAGYQTVLLQPLDGTLRTNPPILHDGPIP